MNDREIKFIIVRDRITNRLHHFKSDWLHHYTIARDNGYDSHEVLEAGLFLAGHKYILECVYIEHLKKQELFYIGNQLNFYHDLRLQNWLKSRQLESQLYYSKRPVGLREGD